MPETWGHDIDVPDSELKSTRRSSKANPVGPDAPVYAARILTPGAVISGYAQREEVSITQFENLKSRKRL